MEIHRCSTCEVTMLRASLYDPDGGMCLYGGYKKHNEDGSLKEWGICINPTCKEGKKNINPQ